MAKVRQDAWSHEDDLLLAETVLRHVREGSTQLNAFEEVGDKLNRTSAACGFRWNAEVRRKYDNAMDLAKRQRKENKRALFTNTNVPKSNPIQKSTITLPTDDEVDSSPVEPIGSPITMDHVIHFLKDYQEHYHVSNQSILTLEQTQQENQRLRENISQLEKELKKTKKSLATIQEDYQVFIQIMDRARKMTVLDDQGTLKSPAFKMDKNGNLQQLAQGLNQ